MVVNYENQEWFNAEATWAVNFAAFQEAQKVDSYTLGDFTETADGDMEMYTDLKVKSAQEAKTIADFYTARDTAFNDLATTQASERQALQDLWQAKEENGYDVDYTPE